MNLLSKMGTKLKELRTKKCMTSEELAKNLDVAKSIIWSYELNKKEPSNTHLIKIADFFDVSVDYLLDREQQNNTVNFQYPLDDVIDKYTFLVDNRPVEKEELLDTIAYIKAKRILTSQDLVK
ncbi:helix-turn-helix domain-containing protein [Paenisporosarcina quisquiliarum]|uniref:Helix-turn-helix domain-containing protein n=1 Tax=Paenisporosarcina quisquiliarum TaxID=365346 RepID=A0A9X3LH60_9BACL|nr:helix-turn-helix transcriptional regulator [Paenisporosarcina quisquiliarum]MCZ8537890.1 helix-turn-helix domain-containing protein [Paenisporosarcina quisquiliarum]